MRKLGFVALATLVMACSGAGDGGVDDGKPKDPVPEGSASAIPPTEPSTLRKVQSCDELGAAIKEDALKKMNDTVDAQIESIKLWFDGQFGGLSQLPGGERTGGASSDANAGAPAPSVPGGSGGTAPPAPGSSAGDYSTTNTQVKGVDEADIVKNDGKYIYLIHGAAFQIVQAWPANTLAASTKVELEGQPTEMFVANGKAVVFSTVNGTAIYQGAGLTPRVKYNGYNNGCYGYGCSYQNPVTKVTVLGVDGTNASVEREFYFEGGYVSSRRVDGHVRAILKGGAYGPTLQTYPQFAPNTSGQPLTKEDHINAWEAMRSKNAIAINATQLSDWLPYTFTKNGNAYAAETVACDRFYVPTQSTTNHGVTHVATFDLTKVEPAKGVAILGDVDTVYSNSDTMVLASKAWINPKTMVKRPENKKAPFVDFLPSTATHLHKFDLKTDPSTPAYVGSGVVPGHVLNQFSIDEKDGVIRVATTEQRTVRTWISDEPKVRPFYNSFTVNRVLATKSDGEKIKIVGDAGDLAPGERIMSARFVNTRGYVVTFRQVDPLFVVDMATPEKLSVLGELKIPGFSEYMHPLDDGHLLTIGRDATETGQRRGIAIQIFDVTNAKAPIAMHKYVFDGNSYGYSEAEQNHKAFTYFESKKLLSFPYYGWSNTGTGSSFRTSAELFAIDLGSGITKLGSVDHSQLFGTANKGYCNGYYSPHVRRSVFMEDVLYSVSYAGVIATDTKNLAAAPIATAALTAPTIPPGTPYQCAF